MAPYQPNLFNQANPSTLIRDIKISMHQAVKDSGKSRDQVVDMMNELAAMHGQKINGRGGLTKETFEKWLNVEDKSRVPSAKGIFYFCSVLGTVAPYHVQMALLGGQVIDGQDMALLKWAKKYHQAKELRKQMKQLEGEI